MTQPATSLDQFTDSDPRPLVRSAGSARGAVLFALAAVLGGLWLFQSLELRREKVVAPALFPAGNGAEPRIQSPPQLFIPPDPDQARQPQAVTLALGSATADAEAQPAQPSRARRQRPAAQPYIPPAPPPYQPPSYAPPPYQPPSYAPPPQVVYDANSGRSQADANLPDRVRAVRFANPGMTIPKGTIIAAVLETALDSTRPGFARAIVTRDVRGFDGRRVLIPRGSRLVGDYKADLASGQGRVQIQWQRLVRPDGAMIYLDSPASDLQGRAGVGGKVNTHFWRRLGDAVLQSIVMIGSQVAVGKVTDGTVLAVPLPAQSLVGSNADRVQPTLTVNQGTSVAVFVAKDLDFSTVEQ